MKKICRAGAGRSPLTNENVRAAPSRWCPKTIRTTSSVRWCNVKPRFRLLPMRRRTDVDPLLHWIASDSFTDNVKREILEFAKTNTTFPHVEPLAGSFVFLAKLRFRVTVNAHNIDRHVILLRC